MKKILIITPFGGIFGSELYISNLIENLVGGEIEVKVFVDLPKGKEFNKQYIYSNCDLSTRKDRLINKVSQFFTGLSLNERKVLAIHKKFKPDFWYINTIILPNYAKLAGKLSIPYLLHIHELPSVYSKMKGILLASIVRKAHSIVVCTEQQKEIFEILGGKNILVLPGAVRPGFQGKNDKAEIKKRLGIPKDSIVFGGCGSTSFTKGFDLFVEMGLNPELQQFHFIWIGRVKDHGYEYLFLEKINKAKSQNFHFPGIISPEETPSIFNIFDYFLLTSREDTFPLVMLEAASLGIPIFSFDSGGVKEFIKPGMGYITKGINPVELKEIILKIMEGKVTFDKDLLKKSAENYSTEKQAKLWVSFINNL